MTPAAHPKPHVHCTRRVSCHLVPEMSEDIPRESVRRVPGHLLDCTQRDALSEQKRRERVPEVVEAHTGQRAERVVLRIRVISLVRSHSSQIETGMRWNRRVTFGP